MHVQRSKSSSSNSSSSNSQRQQNFWVSMATRAAIVGPSRLSSFVCAGLNTHIHIYVHARTRGSYGPGGDPWKGLLVFKTSTDGQAIRGKPDHSANRNRGNTSQTHRSTHAVGEGWLCINARSSSLKPTSETSRATIRREETPKTSPWINR